MRSLVIKTIKQQAEERETKWVEEMAKKEAERTFDEVFSPKIKQMEDSWSETQTRQTSIENTLSSMQEETVKVRNFGEELEQRLEKRRASLNQNLTDLQKRQEEEKQSLDQFVKETTAFRQEAENALSSLKKDVAQVDQVFRTVVQREVLPKVVTLIAHEEQRVDKLLEEFFSRGEGSVLTATVENLNARVNANF